MTRHRRDVALVVLAAAVSSGLPQPALAAEQAGGTPSNPPAAQSAGQSTPAPTPQFTIGETNNVVRLWGTEAITSISATITGLEKLDDAAVDKYVKSLAIIDKGAVRGPSLAGTVQFNPKPEFIGRSGASGLSWRIRIKASDVLTGITQVRHAQATLAGLPTVAVEYSISTKPASAPQWAPKGSSPVWTISWSAPVEQRRFRVLIENQDEPLSNLRLESSTLRTASGSLLDAYYLKLIDPDKNDKDKKEPSGVNVGPNTAKAVLIEFSAPGSGGLGWFGTFEGALRFRIDGTAVTKDVDLKLQASSPYAKLAGVVFAFLGLTGTAVTALLRSYLARVSALRTVLVVREAIAVFQNELTTTCGTQCAGLEATVQLLVNDVSTKKLDDMTLLPPRVAFASEQAVKDTSTALKSHLERVSNRLAGLSILLRDGILLLSASPATNRDALIKDLNAAARTIQGEADARTAVQDALAKQQIPAADTAQFEAMLALSEPTTVAEADRTIRHIAGISWFVWGTTSLAVASAWVLSDVDFGTPMDLFGCFLWGFGLTTFGAGVQSLTTSGIATQVNLKLPG